MKYFSIKRKSAPVSFRDAVTTNIAEDGGLYMPETIPELKKSLVDAMHSLSLHEISYETLLPFLADSFSKGAVTTFIERAFTFDAPLIKLSPTLSVLELFHGPTLAFKDFGVRFLAEILNHLQNNEGRERTIITATSGDTGAAVADAFHNKEGINAFILYPQGKVSPIQELQIASLGGNIRPIEVEGTFDDCQRLVKWACSDKDILSQKNLTSANSINIARLLAQICYYLRGWSQHTEQINAPVISVPSGNFGNITAGLIAKKMGMPCSQFIAATNANDTIPRYLTSGSYLPRQTVETISNAMDISHPNNFVRVEHLFENNLDQLKTLLLSNSFSDKETYQALGEMYEKFSYVADPHTAVAYLGARHLQHGSKIILSTAHPIKFSSIIENGIGVKPDEPPRIQTLLQRQKMATVIRPENSLLKRVIMG